MSKNRMAGSKEFRDKIEERKGTEWYDEALKEGLHDPHMSGDGETARYSGAEIRAELRHGRGDRTVGEMVDYFEKEYASGRMNLNGNAKDFLRDKHGANLMRDGEGGGSGGNDGGGGTTTPETPTPVTPPVVEDETKPAPIGYTPPRYGTSNQTQIVNQDNDINSTVTGDDNNVTNTQDNSVNQYGAYGSMSTADRAKALRNRYVADVSRFTGAS